MASFHKHNNSWEGRIQHENKKISKNFTTKFQAERWENKMRDEINRPYVRKALEMFADGKHQEEIAEIFAEIDINLNDYTVPTYSGHTFTQEEIGNEFGFSQQRVEQLLTRYCKKARLRFIRMNKIPDFPGLTDEEFMYAIIQQYKEKYKIEYGESV